jgi:hypothetical protein
MEQRENPTATFVAAGQQIHDSFRLAQGDRHAAWAEAEPKNRPRIGQARFSAIVFGGFCGPNRNRLVLSRVELVHPAGLEPATF